MENKFGENVKYIRSESDITQKEFANIIGVSAATVSAYEQGEKIPNLSVAMKIAKKFNVSLDWLCGLSDKENQTISDVKDAAKTLFDIGKIIEFEIKYVEKSRERLDREYELSHQIPVIFFHNKEINYFLSEWEKIYSLYYSKTISEDLYFLWAKEAVETLERKSEDYEEKTRKCYSPLDEDDLPF